MKNLFFIVLFLACVNLSKGQNPMNVAPEKPNERNYSNNRTLTKDDWYQNTFHEYLIYEKGSADVLLINRYDGVLECYDLDMQKKWSFTPSDSVRHSNGSNQFYYNDGVIFTAYMTGDIYAINAKNGSLYWEAKIGMDNDKLHFTSQSLQPSNNMLFLTSRTNQNVYAINASSGDLVWNYKLPSPHSYMPCLFLDKKVYINNDPLINSFDAQTGKALYQANFNTNLGKAVTNGEILIVPFNRGNKIVGISPNGMTAVWEFVYNNDYYSVRDKIFIENNKVYFATAGNRDSSWLYCLDSKDGTLVWEKAVKGNVEKIVNINDTIYGYTSTNDLFVTPMDKPVITSYQLEHQAVSNLCKNAGNLYFYAKEGLVRYNLSSNKEEIIIPYDGEDKSNRLDTQILFSN
ncbi:MAG: PQQ-binding-like beta-propeller repeat protein [Bacteroidales bacterium]